MSKKKVDNLKFILIFCQLKKRATNFAGVTLKKSVQKKKNV